MISASVCAARSGKRHTHTHNEIVHSGGQPLLILTESSIWSPRGGGPIKFDADLGQAACKVEKDQVRERKECADSAALLPARAVTAAKRPLSVARHSSLAVTWL